MNKIAIVLLLILAVMAGAVGEHWLQRRTPSTPPPARRVLYWYDPMQPGVHFDHPGKSPSMNMDLLPKYADTANNSGVHIAAAQSQALGMRLGEVRWGQLSARLHASAIVAYDDRQLRVLQARTSGYLEQVVPHTAGDSVRQGELLATLRAPAWTAAQAEDLALRRGGERDLAQAAHQRLFALGMNASEVRRLEHDGAAPFDRIALRAPCSGVLLAADLRPGMTVVPGQTLARVNSLDPVWLEAAVPQTAAAQVWVGQAAALRIAGVSTGMLPGRVIAILPALDGDNRSLTVRIRLRNSDHRLHPGMYATVDLLHTGARHLLVPSEAVLDSGRDALVFLAQDRDHYLPVAVRVGATADGMTEILQGLQAGDRVVLSGQYLVDSEASLANLPIRPLRPPATLPSPPVAAPSPRPQRQGMAGMAGMEGL